MEGSFKTRLGVIVFAGAVALWGFVESDIGKAFLKGITQHEPAHWSEQLGRTIRDAAIDLLSEESQEEDEEALCAAAAEMLVDLAADFLQAETEALQSSGITVKRYRDAYDARNQFYEACERTPGLQGIGFDEAPIFPVQRADFIRLQVPIPPKEDEPEPWIAGLTILKVTNAKVLRVLTYNDESLAEPLDHRALDAILGAFIPVADDQADLFEAR